MCFKKLLLSIIFTWQCIQTTITQASSSAASSIQSTGCKIKQSVPALPEQGDLIQAINTGNLKNFKKCLIRGDDFSSSNAHGYSPDRYLECWLQKSFNPHRLVHKEMFKLITIFKCAEEYGV